MRTFVVTKVFIVNDAGKLLTIRRSETDDRRPLEWDFPGGWLEEGEQPMDAVIREAEEETGLQIRDPQLMHGQTEVTQHGSGTWIFFVARVEGEPEVTLSFEHDQYKWDEPAAVLAQMKYHRQIMPLEYAIEHDLL